MYHYWTIRYVPDIMRLDTVGVGVIVAPEFGRDPVGIKFVETARDIFDIGGSRSEFVNYLADFAEDVKSHDLDNYLFNCDNMSVYEYIERARRQNRGMMQIDPPQPIFGADSQELAEYIYRMLIYRPPQENQMSHGVQLRREIQNIYKESIVISPYLQTRYRLGYGVNTNPMDVVIGLPEHKYIEMTRSFSFRDALDQTLSDRLAAWSKRVEYLRKNGGEIYDSRKGLVAKVDKDVPLCVVVESGMSDKSKEWESQQLDIWQMLDIKVRQRSDVSVHLSNLERDIQNLIA